MDDTSFNKWHNNFLVQKSEKNIAIWMTFILYGTHQSNSLDPDQAQHFGGPDPDPNCLQKWSTVKKVY